MHVQTCVRNSGRKFNICSRARSTCVRTCGRTSHVRSRAPGLVCSHGEDAWVKGAPRRRSLPTLEVRVSLRRQRNDASNQLLLHALPCRVNVEPRSTTHFACHTNEASPWNPMANKNHMNRDDPLPITCATRRLSVRSHWLPSTAAHYNRARERFPARRGVYDDWVRQPRVNVLPDWSNGSR